MSWCQGSNPSWKTRSRNEVCLQSEVGAIWRGIANLRKILFTFEVRFKVMMMTLGDDGIYRKWTQRKYVAGEAYTTYVRRYIDLCIYFVYYGEYLGSCLLLWVVTEESSQPSLRLVQKLTATCFSYSAAISASFPPQFAHSMPSRFFLNFFANPKTLFSFQHSSHNAVSVSANCESLSLSLPLSLLCHQVKFAYTLDSLSSTLLFFFDIL